MYRSAPALAAGAWLTVICTVAAARERAVAGRQPQHVDAADGEAGDGVRAWALPKLTTPAPGVDTTLQVVVRAPGGFGRPSSLAPPTSVTLDVGRVTTFEAPAWTTGAWLVPKLSTPGVPPTGPASQLAGSLP